MTIKKFISLYPQKPTLENPQAWVTEYLEHIGATNIAINNFGYGTFVWGGCLVSVGDYAEKITLPPNGVPDTKTLDRIRKDISYHTITGYCAVPVYGMDIQHIYKAMRGWIGGKENGKT